MKSKIIITFIITILLLNIACLSSSNVNPPENDDPTTVVQPTLTVQPQPTQELTQEPTPIPTALPSPTIEMPTETITGGISGHLYYPSSMIPEMYLVVFNVETNEIFYMETEFNQFTFQMDGLPPGKYYVTTYLPYNPDQEDKYKFINAVTEYDMCKRKTPDAACGDHTLAIVEVLPGQITTDLHIADTINLLESGLPINPIQP